MRRCLARTGHVDAPPAPGQPDPIAVGDHLECEEHRHGLEHVRDPAGGQRERGDPEQEHEHDREAPLPEKVDEAAERLVSVAVQPTLELVAEPILFPRRLTSGNNVDCPNIPPRTTDAKGGASR